MGLYSNIWKLLAGISFFLLGMNYIELSLRGLVSRTFKLFLKKQTSSTFKSILSGALSTAVLQSSSVVNLIVLAFVSANVIQIRSALGLVLGANLGSTFSSWIIAIIGFSFNIDSFAFPLVGVAGIFIVLLSQDNKWYNISKVIFGFGLLFLGLDYIKNSMSDLMGHLNFISFNHYPSIFFLLLGFLITALIQSSMTTMAIVLSALNLQAIDLLSAAALILGSEVGTTIKLLIASFNGPLVKKRVAVGNFFFNVISAIPIFIFLPFIINLITLSFNISDNIILLVLFQTLVNLFCILLFYPFLKGISAFLEKKIKNAKINYLSMDLIDLNNIDNGIVALETDSKRFLLQSIQFLRNVFDLPEISPKKGYGSKVNLLKTYGNLKFFHGQLYNYSLQLLNASTDKKNIVKVNNLIDSNRNAMYALKSIKDAMQDIVQLKNSANDFKYLFYQKAMFKAVSYASKVDSLLLTSSPSQYFKELKELYIILSKDYVDVLTDLFKNGTNAHLSEIEISTLINFNREIYTAYKSYSFALKHFLLDPVSAASFDELPGFIR